MRHLLLTLFIFTVYAQAADSMQSWFKEGSLKANAKYYFIETKKDKSGGSHTSAHANAIGGKLNYTTGTFNGLQAGVTFMTTHGFALPNSVDTSILSRDDGVRRAGSTSGTIAQDSLTVLGEAFVKYTYEDFTALYGRKVISTPLINSKEVRMIPSAVQGAFVEYKLEQDTRVGASYLTHFKQRTSDEFTNIVKHALGNNTQAITGSDEGEVVVLKSVYKSEKSSFQMLDYYAEDFLNSLYLEAGFKNRLDSGVSYKAQVQYINQISVGNADNNLALAGSATGGKKINANAFGLKMDLGYKESGLTLAFTKVLSDANEHDALVLPWDGTPLFTNMITSNNLFQSNYGNALNSDSIYIGGSTGVKLAYTQKYDFTGVKGFKTALAMLNVNNNRFAHNQRDLNAVISYGIGDFSLALKGIWVRYNTSAGANGAINAQDDRLTQYRVIANYKF